jgi:hypothetical protein
MSGCFFNCGPGRLTVHFVQRNHGWMYMHLRLRAGVDTVTQMDESFAPPASSSGGGELLRRILRISAVFCPLPQMIAWLEAVSLGLNRFSWQWDGEGCDYCLEWNGSRLVIGDDSSAQPGELRVQLPRRELVAGFYLRFRRFAQSRRYRPADYERRRLGEILVEADGRGLIEEEQRGRLLTVGAAELERTLQGWHGKGILAREQCSDRFPSAYLDPEAQRGSMRLWRFPYVADDWDGWDTPRRRWHLREIFDSVDEGQSGTPLRSLRSEIVERFLNTGSAKAR